MFTPTLQDISGWGGAQLLKDGEVLLKQHALSNVRFSDGTASADVAWGGASIRTGFALHRGNPRIIDSLCHCAANPDYVEGILREGAERARAIAAPTLAAARKAVGLAQ